MGTRRKTSEERRKAIIEAIKVVFAEKGFEKATTRELAKAAGVSEALLYKHFPSKESMYAAIHEDFIKNKKNDEIERLMKMKPSTETLVIMVYSILNHFIKEGANKDAGFSTPHLLMTRSLLEDGKFARVAYEQMLGGWVTQFVNCLKAAEKAGDLRESPVRFDLSGWFVHHIAINMMLTLYSNSPAVDYKMSGDKLVEQAVWYALQGAGLKAAAIRRYYNKETLSKLYE